LFVCLFVFGFIFHLRLFFFSWLGTTDDSLVVEVDIQALTRWMKMLKKERKMDSKIKNVTF